MSSSSPRRRSWLAAGALAVVAGALVWAAPVGAATTLDVVAVVPGDAEVTLVVGVDPPPSLAQPGTFEVASGDSGQLPTDARPVLGPQLAAATVLDTSAAGAGDLQNGINGSTNLLLQLPDGVRNLVIADGGDAPRTLSPLTQGATEAVAALNSAHADGNRHTGAALDAAAAGLPPEAGRSRLVLLYTGAPDAGGEPADQLGRRLARAGVVLAVVTTGPGQRYWSDAAGVTGGVVVPTTGAASLKPFDQLASALRSRFVLTFPRPSTLPATVRVSMTVAGQTVSRSAMVPEVSAETAAPPTGKSGPSPWMWVLGALVLLALIGGGLLLIRRRWPAPVGAPQRGPAGTPEPAGFEGNPQALPRRRPTPGTSTIAARAGTLPPVRGHDEPPHRTAPDQPAAAEQVAAADRDVGAADRDVGAADRDVGAADRSVGAADRSVADRSVAAADRSVAAADRSVAAADRGVEAADRAAAEAAERAGVGRRVGDPAGAQPAGAQPAGRSTLPRRRPGASAARRTGSGVDDATVEMARPPVPGRQHPAADARAYSRLYDETDRVAAAVAEGRMEFRHAVAKIALAAPGRVDLLDRVIETERRLVGVQMGASAPSEVTLKLLTTARRVVSGEVALVGPTGERVEQASSGLRLIHPDRTTREYRSANELARHLDLDTLSVDAPTS
jgi:hypothetical protein